MINKNDIPAIYLFVLEMQGKLDEYLIEANNQNNFWRRKAYLATCYSDFINRSFFWYSTVKGFGYWLGVAKEEVKL